jgi:hypothetical protein
MIMKRIGMSNETWSGGVGLSKGSIPAEKSPSKSELELEIVDLDEQRNDRVGDDRVGDDMVGR